MADFIIPENRKKVTFETFAKGFGLPLVKSAFLAELNNFPNIKADKADGLSQYFNGTVVYDTLFIKTPFFYKYEYSDVDKKYIQTSQILSFVDKKGNDNGILLDGVLISVNQTKNIITTNIMGRSGTVKEYINQGDFEFTIRGFIASKNPDEYPLERVRVLQQYLNAPTELEVVSNYINNVFAVDNNPITKVVVVDYNMFQQEGVRNIQFFEFTCLSDTVNIIEENNANS
jgi:hypothetical protein